MCKDTSLYIERAQLCDSQIDCPDGSDECDDSCDQNVLNNPKRILGAVALLAVVWILGMITITQLLRPRAILIHNALSQPVSVLPLSLSRIITNYMYHQDIEPFHL